VVTENTPTIIKKVTKILNGGYNGLSHRLIYTKRAYTILKKAFRK